MFQRKLFGLKTYGRNNVSNIDVGYGERPSWNALVNKRDDFDMLFSKTTRVKDLENDVFNASFESSSGKVSDKFTTVRPTIKTLLIDRSLEDEGKLPNAETKKRNCIPKNVAKKKSALRKINRNYINTIILDSSPDSLIAKERVPLKRKPARQKNSEKDQSKNIQILKPITISNTSETAPLGTESLVDCDQSSFTKKLRSSKSALENQENENQSSVILDSTPDSLIAKERDSLKRKSTRQKNSEKSQSENSQILKPITISSTSETAPLGTKQSSFTKKLRSSKSALENQEDENQSFGSSLEFDKPNPFKAAINNNKTNANILNTNKTPITKHSKKDRINNFKSRLNTSCKLSNRGSIDDFVIPGAALKTRKKQKISITLSEDESEEIPNFQEKSQLLEVDLNDKSRQSFPKVYRMTTTDQNSECNLSVTKNRNIFVKPQTILRKKSLVPVISTPINGYCEKTVKFKKNLGGVELDTPSPIVKAGQVSVVILSDDSDIAVISSNSASTNLESITSNLSKILEEPSKLDESTAMASNNNLNFSECVEISRNLFRTSTLDPSVDINEVKDFEISALLTGSKNLGKKLSDTEEILELCKQEDILQFNDLFPKRLTSHNSKKISEGAFSEVFKIKFGNEWFVAKIIPVGGKNPLDGEKHMSLKAVLTEIIISESLSKLRESAQNQCSTFIQLFETKFVRGPYPKGLISAWKDYDSENESENYNPVSFDKDQLYVILKYEDGGKDLENNPLSKYAEVLSAYRQLSCALAIAEKSLNFEHRDLHLGNILISKTKDKCINFVLDGKTITIETSGVQVRIIDHTLSRLSLNNVNIFTNLSEYDIFNGTGDSQYDVYREMKAISENDWECYHPETNVLWLNFVLEKMMKKIKRPTSTMILFRKKTFLKERLSAFECMHGVIT